MGAIEPVTSPMPRRYPEKGLGSQLVVCRVWNGAWGGAVYTGRERGGHTRVRSLTHSYTSPRIIDTGNGVVSGPELNCLDPRSN
ncbi:hypothetical protein J6590_082685 [Homalodisca vitripennis]|nr:hypothetical protein J6590_082685 [Homalodisca vitripennis]